MLQCDWFREGDQVIISQKLRLYYDQGMDVVGGWAEEMPSCAGQITTVTHKFCAECAVKVKNNQFTWDTKLISLVIPPSATRYYLERNNVTYLIVSIASDGIYVVEPKYKRKRNWREVVQYIPMDGSGIESIRIRRREECPDTADDFEKLDFEMIRAFSQLEDKVLFDGSVDTPSSELSCHEEVTVGGTFNDVRCHWPAGSPEVYSMYESIFDSICRRADFHF